MKTLQATMAIVCCHILTGTASVTTRYLVSVLEPVEIAFLRYLFGGLAVLPLFFIFRSPHLTRSLLFKIIGLGILFFGLFPFLFSWAFTYTSAARGSLVLATMPLWTILLGNFIGHEKLNHLSLVAICLTLIGLVIGISDKLFQTSEHDILFKGELIMLAAALVGAVYIIFSRAVLRLVSASTMTSLAMLSGCFCLFPFTLASGIDAHLMMMSPLQLGLVVYLGVVAGGIAFFLLNWSLNKSTATFTALFVTLNPVTAIFLGNIFLGEVIKTNFIIGVLIVFSGLGLAVKSEMRESYL